MDVTHMSAKAGRKLTTFDSAKKFVAVFEGKTRKNNEIVLKTPKRLNRTHALQLKVVL